MLAERGLSRQQCVYRLKPASRASVYACFIRGERQPPEVGSSSEQPSPGREPSEFRGAGLAAVELPENPPEAPPPTAARARSASVFRLAIAFSWVCWILISPAILIFCLSRSALARLSSLILWLFCQESWSMISDLSSRVGIEPLSSAALSRFTWPPRYAAAARSWTSLLSTATLASVMVCCRPRSAWRFIELESLSFASE